jgi:hypothetical protein
MTATFELTSIGRVQPGCYSDRGVTLINLFINVAISH